MVNMKGKFLKSPKVKKGLGISLAVLLCALPIILMVFFLSGIKGGKSSVDNTVTDKTNKSTLKEVASKNENGSTGNEEQSETSTTDDRYVVSDGQEAIQSKPTANYSGADETDEFFSDAVFVGDSITVGWSLYVNNKGNGFFGNPKFLAKVGYSSHSALSAYYEHPSYLGTSDYIYKSIAKMDVSKVFISFGLNDALSNPQAVLSDYERVINLILRYSPDVKIYVISTTYVVKGSERGYVTSANVREYNKLVKAFCAENDYTYVDVSSYLVTTDGYLPRAYSSDGYVHLNAQAYSIWEIVLRNLAQVEINVAEGKKTNSSQLATLPAPVKETGGYVTPTESQSETKTASQTSTGTQSTEKTSATGSQSSQSASTTGKNNETASKTSSESETDTKENNTDANSATAASSNKEEPTVQSAESAGRN